MKSLKYFIGGILFYIIAIPIVESIAETFTTLLEIPKGKVSVKVLKLSKTLQELQVDLEKHDESVCMGFDITSSEDYDEDDLDDKKKSKKSKYK
ncbi:MAG: hypothetical protein K0S41_2049 [Anaerocolumna sp.]|jgi:hypothetical protein|nr:hypothetical protein [Anaerocolumna sp.]